MLRRATIFLALFLFVSATAIAATTTVHPTVSPKAITRTTPVTVKFKTKQKTGVSGIIRTNYQVDAVHRRASGCTTTAIVDLKAAPRGRTVRGVLRRGTKKWCKGLFRGNVWIVTRPYCKSGSSCPSLPTQRKRVGKFSFRVH